MVLRGVAFHESVTLNEMTRILAEYNSILFAPPTSLSCGSCGARFITFFVVTEADDSAYPEAIEARVAEDCSKGIHPNRKIEQWTNP